MVDRIKLSKRNIDATLQGRILVPFIMGTYQSERFSAAKGSVIWSGGATANGSCW